MIDLKRPGPVTSEEMLHPAVLKVFNAKSRGSLGAAEHLRRYGLVDIEFPSMYDAAAWVRVWERESVSQPPVMLAIPRIRHGVAYPPVHSFFGPVTVTVTEE